MRKTHLFCVLSMLMAGCLSVGVLAACESGSAPEDQAPYDESGFSSGGGNTDIFVGLEMDDDMTIDGELNEARWENKNWFTYTDSGVTVQATTSLSDLGVYVALKNDDSGVYYNSGRDIWLNSSFEIYIDRFDSMQKTENTLQVRMDYENTETYQGYPEASYPWKVQYRPVYGRIAVDGELNSGNANGMSCEMFVSWEALGYDMDAESFEAPDAVKMFVAYSKASGVDTTSRDAWVVNTDTYNDTAFYWLFDGNGFAQSDAENAEIGDSPIHRVKTAGWEVNDDGTVKSVGKGNQFIWFTQNGDPDAGTSTSYAFTAKLKYLNSIEDDYPRMGVTLASDDSAMYAFFVRLWDRSETSIAGEFFRRTYSGSIWEMEPEIYNHAGNYNAEEGIRVTGVKYGSTLFVFLGDGAQERYGGEFVALTSYNDVAGAAVPGFFTMGCSVEYSDYAMTTDPNEINEILDGYISQLDVRADAHGLLSGYDAIYPKSEETFAEISISANEGYYLSSITVNDVERIADVRDGTLTIQMNEDNITVVPHFRQIEEEQYFVSGAIALNDGMRLGDVEVIIQSQLNDGKLYLFRPYINRMGDGYGIELTVPNGVYDYIMKYDGEEVSRTQFSVNGAEATLPAIGFYSTFGQGKGGSQAVGSWNTALDPVSISVDANGKERNRYIFYKDGGDSTRFMFETVIRTDGALVAGESWPMAGIVLQNTDASGDVYRMVVLVRAGSLSMADWSGRATLITWYDGDNDGRIDPQEPNYTGSRPVDDEGLRLTVVRDGTNLYVFINGTFIVNYNVRFTADMKTDVGLAVGGGSISTFSDFVYSEDNEILNAWIELAQTRPDKVDLAANGTYWLDDATSASFVATGKFTHATGSGWATAGFNVTVGQEVYRILPYFDGANMDTNILVIHQNDPWGARNYWKAGATMSNLGNVEYTFTIALLNGTLYIELAQGENVVRHVISASTAANWGDHASADFDEYYAALFSEELKKIGLQCQDGTASVNSFAVSFEQSDIEEFISLFN